ncbi:MAG: alpha/beta hydrolase [Motiliproteus sp.]
MPFDPRSLIAKLPPFDPGNPQISSGFDGYRQFCDLYQLNFDDLASSQQLGQLDIDDQQIAIHRFCAARSSSQQPSLPCNQGTLLIVHGYLDHHALYRHIIRYGLAHNLDVIGFDLPGHGLSSGPRATIDSFNRYQRLLTTIIEQVHRWQPDQRLHLLGQSTGAAIINQYLLTADREGKRPSIDGDVVLLAPLVRASHWHWVSLMHGLLSPWKRSVKRDFAANSHDPQFNAFLPTDPLQSATISVDWVGALKQWVPHFNALTPRQDLKPLVVQGQQDATVDWRYNLGVIGQKYPNLRSVSIPAGRHQLANESETIRQHYLGWLDQQGFAEATATRTTVTAS